MTNPNDPRTPQERAYALDEQARRTDASGETQGFDDSTRVLHTSDPTEAYGRPVSNPTLVYPSYDPTAGQYQPTQAYPGYDAAAGHHPTQAYTGAHAYQGTQPFPGTQSFPAGAYPPGTPPPGAPPSAPPPASGARRSPRGPRWGAVALAAIVLIALGGAIGYLLSRSDEPADPVASRPTPTVAPPPAPVEPLPDPQSPNSPLDRLPGGLGEVLGDTGAVVGTITANDGGSITVGGIGGSSVTVLITPETSILAIGGTTADDLEIGANVVATGTPVRDGSMTAETIISASMPSFERPGG